MQYNFKTNIMKANKFFKVFISLFFFASFAQDLKLNINDSKVTVDGTSNVHDWTVEAKAMNGKMNAQLESALKINQLTFSVEVEQLKSGKSGMDKNTYKALNSTKFKTIDFKMTRVQKMTKVSENNYQLDLVGDLTIAGITKTIVLTASAQVQGNKLVLTGKHKLNMTYYGVEAPKALMGTIKTGEEVTVNFKVMYQ